MGRAAGQRDLHFYVAAAVGRLLRLSHMPGWNIRMRIRIASLLMAALAIVAPGRSAIVVRSLKSTNGTSPTYPDLATWRAAEEKAARRGGLRFAPSGKGELACRSGRRARPGDPACRSGRLPRVRLREHACGPGHAGVGAAGNAAGDAAAHRVHRRGRVVN